MEELFERYRYFKPRKSPRECVDMKLVLRELTLEDEQAFLEAVKDWEGEDLSWFTFDWKPGMSHEDHLERLRQNKRGYDLPWNYVPSTMLYGFVNGKIVGRVNIRHRLNVSLLNRGGHLGYAIAPKYRKQGYATEMVKQAIPICKKLGIDRLLITCAKSNVASVKMIQKLHPVEQNELYDEIAQEDTYHFWLNI